MNLPIGTRVLLDLLKVPLPIIQAPMAGVSTPAMAAAVSNAGGLGSISVGATDHHGARAMIESVRALTDAPFNVNLFCHQPAVADIAVETAWIDRFRPVFARFGAAPPPALTEIYRSFLDDEAMQGLVLELRPAVVSFHFGLPSRDWIGAMRQAGMVLLATATSPFEAFAAAEAGVHAVVAQGYEAGGHRGMFDPDAPDDRLSALALTTQLSRALHIPTIAAGGIMTGADIAAALQAGAAGVQMGTAFIATDESLAGPSYRDALSDERALHTVMTRAISGRPARSLPNPFTALVANVRPDEVPVYPLAYDLGKALHAAASATGEFGFGAQWAGTGAPRSRPMPAARLIALLVSELRAALAQK